jgi:hypothetical protein
VTRGDSRVLDRKRRLTLRRVTSIRGLDEVVDVSGEDDSHDDGIPANESSVDGLARTQVT